VVLMVESFLDCFFLAGIRTECNLNPFPFFTGLAINAA